MRDLIHHWFALLAADDFDAAVSLLYHPADRGIASSAQSLRECLARYQPSSPLHPGPSRVTPAETAVAEFEPVQEVYFNIDGDLASADWSVPINGEWSDLMAFFDFHVLPDGVALSLRDVYVS